MELKADMLQLKVFKIKTGELVVCDDDNLVRFINEKGKIEEYTFNELRKLLAEGKISNSGDTGGDCDNR